MATNDSMNNTNFDYFYNENINEIMENRGSSEGNILDDANNMEKAAAQLYNTKTRYDRSVPGRTWKTWEGRETSYDSKETVLNLSISIVSINFCSFNSFSYKVLYSSNISSKEILSSNSFVFKHLSIKFSFLFMLPLYSSITLSQ